MTRLIALLIGVLGLGMVVFGVLALRDDPPRWMLRVKRPGWVLFAGLLTIVVAFLVNATVYNIEDDVEDQVGRVVTCDEVGSLEVEGESRDVYACQAKEGGEHLGCFVRVAETAVDVSRRAEEPGALGPGTVDC